MLRRERYTTVPITPNSFGLERRKHRCRKTASRTRGNSSQLMKTRFCSMRSVVAKSPMGTFELHIAFSQTERLFDTAEASSHDYWRITGIESYMSSRHLNTKKCVRRLSLPVGRSITIAQQQLASKSLRIANEDRA